MFEDDYVDDDFIQDGNLPFPQSLFLDYDESFKKQSKQKIDPQPANNFNRLPTLVNKSKPQAKLSYQGAKKNQPVSSVKSNKQITYEQQHDSEDDFDIDAEDDSDDAIYNPFIANK